MNRPDEESDDHEDDEGAHAEGQDGGPEDHAEGQDGEDGGEDGGEAGGRAPWDEEPPPPPKPRVPLDPESRGQIDEYERLRVAGERPMEPFSLPWDWKQTLEVVTPQALLRDLHRPIGKFGITGYDVHETGMDPGARGVIGDLKTALYANYRVPITTLIPERGIVPEIAAEIRAALGGKWEECPKQGYKPVTTEADQTLVQGLGGDWL